MNLLINHLKITKNDEFDNIRFDTLSLNDSNHISSQNNSKISSISAIKNQQQQEPSSNLDIEETTVHFKFNPPLYIQRYDYVSDLLKKYECKTYLDIGAAECKLLRYLKNASKDLNLIIGLDVDESVLFNNREKFSVGWFDYIQPKDQPIEVYLIRGDISEPSSYFLNQVNLINMDLDFVSLVELIEHLYPSVLIKCIDTVFARIKPKFVLMTTPNQEFNVVFQDDDPTKFRHWDHKFEWTRNEFQTWCHNIVCKYTEYELVFFDGIGQPPNEFINVGHCSQIVLFKRKNIVINDNNNNNNNNTYQDYITQLKRANYINRQQARNTDDTENQKIEIPPYFDPCMLNNNNNNEIGSEYNLISFTRYPFESFEFENIESRNQAIVNEINYLINFLSRPNRTNTNTNNNNNNDTENIELTEEQIEKISNNIDIYDEKIRIASVEKIFSFSNIQKFKLENDDLIGLMIEYGFQFTNGGKYVYQYLADNESDYHESDRSYTNSYDNYDWNTNSRQESNTDAAAAENWDDDNEHLLTSPIKSAFNEEDWDEEMLNSSHLKNSSMLDESLNKSLTTSQIQDEPFSLSTQFQSPPLYREFTPRDQFEDCDPENNNDNDYDDNETKSGKIYDESSSNKLNISSQNTETSEDSNNNEIISYHASQAKILSLKFKKLHRKNRRELRNKSFDLRIVPSQFEFIFE